MSTSRYAAQYFEAKDLNKAGATFRAKRLEAGKGLVEMANGVGVYSAVLTKFETATQQLFRDRDRTAIDLLCESLGVKPPTWQESSITEQRSKARKRVVRRKAAEVVVQTSKTEPKPKPVSVQVSEVPMPAPQQDVAQDSLTAVLVLYKRGVLGEKVVLDIIKRFGKS